MDDVVVEGVKEEEESHDGRQVVCLCVRDHMGRHVLATPNIRIGHFRRIHQIYVFKK